MQFQSDMLAVPVVRTVVEEASALGVAFMGGLGSGMWQGLGEIEALRRVDRVFTPAMPRSGATITTGAGKRLSGER